MPARRTVNDRSRFSLLRSRRSIRYIIALLVLGWAAPDTAHSQNAAAIWKRPEKPMTMSEAREFLSCKTHMSFMQGHGTQVSFTAPDGKVFLWYPGNKFVMPGQWEVRSHAVLKSTLTVYAEICFRYGPNTWNPVTGVVGGAWQCMPADFLVSVTTDSAEGDLFDLRQRPVPAFVLSKEKTSLKQLEDRASQSGNPVSNGAGAWSDVCDKAKTS
jgi:hypothetical protein